MKNTSKHIPFAELTDLAEKRISGEQQTAATEHLSECSACTQEFERVGNVLELMRTDTSADAPRDVLAYALNIFNKRESSAPSLLRRIVAALSFDSSANLAPAFGVRSGQATTRQLLYAAEDNDIDIRLTPDNENWIISGQVLGGECVGGRIEIEGEGERASAELSDMCEFTLPAIGAGSYSLRLQLGSAEIEIPQLELRA